MTTRDMIHGSAKRRVADERQYSVYYALGFALFLPFVMVARLLPGVRPPRQLASGDRESVLEQTRAEVHNVLAFVFMA
jgi:hypothetical protein